MGLIWSRVADGVSYGAYNSCTIYNKTISNFTMTNSDTKLESNFSQSLEYSFEYRFQDLWKLESALLDYEIPRTQLQATNFIYAQKINLDIDFSQFKSN